MGLFFRFSNFTSPRVDGFGDDRLSEKLRSGTGQWTGEAVATFGLVLTILGTEKMRPQWIPASVALYITAAYWFTSSTSFANPSITVARSLSNSFAGIAPSCVLPFIAAQIVGALIAYVISRELFATSDRKAAL